MKITKIEQGTRVVLQHSAEANDETLLLKISNRQVVSVPPGSTLLIENHLVNGKVSLIVVEGSIQFSDALKANKKRVTTDLTKA